MTKTFISCLLFLFMPFLLQAQERGLQAGRKYEPGVIIFKLKNESTAGAKATRSKQAGTGLARELAQSVGATSFDKALNQVATAKAANARSAKPHPLSEIYRMEIPDNMPLEKALLQLQSDKRVAYAEPYYLPELLEAPDDEFLAQQKHLQNIKAEAAWQVSQGSNEVVVGILDTGVDFNHPDLQENLYLNAGEIPNDGIDNDGDGFIDNYRGWDFANHDNDPTADKNGHGTFVTGLSSASTNNDIGIAGTGYKCKYMPIKVFRSSDNRFSNGYEAMVYAADMGCDVINLSWGSAGFRSQYVQDIINYVVLEKDVVIVAAAGNTPEELNFYPASYDHVLSVSSSDYTDKKADYATWSSFVDILAPGLNVFSTTNGGGYGTGSGTSYAAPQAAGAAALVRAHFPELSALQVVERLRMAADDVNGLEGNKPYHEKIGKGRLNMEKALARAVAPAVRMQQFEIFNGSGPFAFYNDTLEIRMDFINYLSATTDLEVSLSTNSPYVTLIDSVISFPAINTLEKVRNENPPFRIYLHPDLPGNEVIKFRLGYADINYSDYQHFQLSTSGSFLDFKANDLALTIASNGNLGYNYDYNLQGIGFRYKNAPLAHNLGLVIAHSSTAVANNMLLTVNPAVRDQDFTSQSRLKLYNNSTAFRDARAAFSTLVSKDVPLNLVVEQKILAWEDTLNSGSFILEYRIINTGELAYKQLHTGLFADFDIQEFYKNKIAWDASHLLGYAYDHEESQYAGVALLSDYVPGFHALDIASRNGNQTELGDSISRAEKYQYLAGGISKETAGAEGSGNDVAQLLGGTIPELAPQQGKKIAFALLRASSLKELQEATLLARARYDEYINTPPLHAQVLACPASPLEIQPSGGNLFYFYSDPKGENLLAEGSSLLLENPETDTTFYIANADLSYPGDIERIEVLVKEPQAVFSMHTDTLAINEGETAVLSLTEQGEFSASWKWDFSNGYTSTKQSPKAYFKIAGTYNISLETTNIAGCTAGSSQQLVIVYKEEAPPIADQLLCSTGSTTTLQATDGGSFSLYADAEKQDKIFEGSLFKTSPLQKDTLFYASRGSGFFESDLKQVNIRLMQAGVSINYAIDSTAENIYEMSLQAEIKEPELVARVEWYINGTLESNETRLQWPYTATDTLIVAQALVFYSNGCQAAHEEHIRLLPGNTPLLEPVYTCKGEVVVVRPVEEGIYYFYDDENKQDLLKKGREYTLPPLLSSRTLWVTNISQGQESSLQPAQLIVPDSLAYFTPSADTIGLYNKAGVTFTSHHQEVTEWLWDFGDGFISQLAAPEHTYSGPGTYTVSLTAGNSHGCTDTFSRAVMVVQTTGLAASKKRAGHLKVYPNPADQYTLVALPILNEAATLELRGLNGRLLYSQQLNAGEEQLQLDLEGIIKGVYLLQLKTKKEVFVHRLIIK